MQPLTAIDAIAPAFKRSNELLFARPRKWGRVWKLTATSYLAYVGSLFIPYPLFLLFIPRGSYPGPMLHGALVAILMIPFLLYLALFYCGVRMEFVEFEMVVTKSKIIAPMWRRYGTRTWPWLLLKLVISTVLCCAMAPVAVKIMRTFFTQMQSMPQTPGAQPDPAQIAAFMQSFAGFYALFFATFVLLKLFSTLLNDFVLPFYTLEEIPLVEAIRRGLRVIAAEPLHIAGYLVLKLVLAMLGMTALYVGLLVCMIPVIILVVLLALVGGAIGHAMPGAAGHLLLGVGAVLLGGASYLAFLALVLSALGYVMNVLESYGVYFLGGRYQLLGDYLEPPAPDYTYTPPPAFPSAEERTDDNGDPPLPMDPVLA